VKRYRQIATILLKYGFGGIVRRLDLRRYLDLARGLFRGERGVVTRHPSRWERARMALEELGPSFIKLGQIMSARRDMLPQDFLAELEKLQDDVPPFSWEEAKQIIESDLGDSIDVFFKEFTPTPIGSASIAQVHRAVLRNGQAAAVKVQRPGIERVIETDLEIMLDLATLMQRHLRGMDIVNPVAIVEEFARTIKKEMDFNIEASHIERFAVNFRSDPRMYVPKVFRELTTRRVLTMEFIEGTKVSERGELVQRGLDPEVIAHRGADLILEEVFEHGFFHADPHPGNIMVLEGNVICLLDFGITGRLPPTLRELLSALVMGVVLRDEGRITRAVLTLSKDSGPEHVEEIEADVADFVERHFYRPLRGIRMASLLNEFVGLLIRHSLKLPRDFYLLIKTLVTTEGVGRSLLPDFDMVKHMEPFASKLARRRLSPQSLSKDFYSWATELAALLREFPREAREIITRVKSGKARIEFQHRGLEPMLQIYDRVSNRIAFAIVLASLVVGSSLIVLADIAPKWYDIPIIGIVGFLVAGVMALWLLVSILTHGRM